MFPDSIAAQLHGLYDSLGKSGKPKEGEEWTCLAGVLVENQNELKVASLATGTKCLGGNALVLDGSVLHDSHAEVLARRNFLRYLYDQVDLARRNCDSSIFEKCQERYNLKNGVKFHFYASQVPCGDASIIPMERGLEAPDSGEPAAKRMKVDVHRTGAKPVKTDPRQDPKTDGMGYHARGAVRIKPGRGDPTRSLSCSDKIAKWLFCGLQGALLSLLVPDPIELSSIVIGGAGPYDADVMAEALFRRSGLLQTPHLLRSSMVFRHSPEATGATRPCPASISWADVTHKKQEVSVEGRRLGVTKSTKSKSHLLTSKSELFATFLRLTDDPSYQEMTYNTVKRLSLGYCTREERFVSAMGSWSEDKSHYENFRTNPN